ncbi:MAG: hypothetical protein GEU91_19300 [Rhizobiales bacterium]|nr:hypothetical protein [Hyphomicrobiales bacterium]
MPLDAFWLPLLIKMAVTAAFVIAATKAAERAGALVAGMIATLPIAAGPSYVFLAFEHDPTFIADSALASLVINAATGIMALVYAALAQRRGLVLSLGAALCVWFALAAVVRSAPWTTTGAIAFNIVVFAVCIGIGNRFGHVRMPPVRRRWYDVPLRAVLVGLLVAVVVELSHRLGPTMTGILAVFPIVVTSLMAILHPRIGGPATAAVIAHTISGLVGFSLCCLTARLLVVPLGMPLGLSIALAVSIAANMAIGMIRRALVAQR